MAVKGVEAWVRKLALQSMPVGGEVVAELNKLTGSDDATLQQMGEVILRDPNLTSHVLRAANSVVHNQGRAPINTVSRAIALLGVKGMRAISISVLFIDSLLAKGPKTHLLQLMAKGFHAANQAKNLVMRFDEQAGEEVFVAALLHHVGEMAFWSCEKLTQERQQLLHQEAAKREQFAKAYLGTGFKDISLGLAKHWKLGSTLVESLEPGAHESLSRKVQIILLAERISEAAPGGWESPPMQAIVREIAEMTQVDEQVALTWVLDGAEQAAEIALKYGAHQLCPLIPGRDHRLVAPSAMAVGRVLQADPQVQLNILRELGAASAEALDVNTIFKMVIEGMHRGIGFERVVLAFIQHHRVSAKFVLGQGTEEWKQSFNFDASPFCDNLFTQAIRAGGALWFKGDELKRLCATPDSQPIVDCLGEPECLVFALDVNGRKPAVFYADRGSFGGAITQDHFESFRHFALQAQTNLCRVSAPKARPVSAAR
ncbi:MAG: HDOD domain-containing protein [Marinagarivorans sp.]